MSRESAILIDIFKVFVSIPNLRCNKKKRENIRDSDVVISQTFYQGIVPRHFYPDSFADIARRFF